MHNTIKAVIATLIIGSSSAAMAQPAGFSAQARASFTWGNTRVQRPAPRPMYTQPAPVVVRDHRYSQNIEQDSYIDDDIDQESYDRGFNRQVVNYPTYSYQDPYYTRFAPRINVTGFYRADRQADGDVSLAQNGDRVHGSFDQNRGRMEGQIVGNQIFYQWSDGEHHGRGTWTIDAGGRLSGTWGANQSDRSAGTWNLQLVSR